MWRHPHGTRHSHWALEAVTNVLRIIAINFLVVVGLLVAVEGIIGYTLAVRDAMQLDLAEHRHARYDPELGWVHIPSTSIPDMYGPGVGLSINGQGFRAARDFTDHVPAGRLRVICSGDSFTLGYGVDDADTWCARLQDHDARFETINMGQGGYGFDQAYLWYKRDGLRFEHHAIVAAFITDDFYRMTSTDEGLHGKPVLAIDNGVLAVRGVPVPYRAADRLVRVGEAVSRLHTFALARRTVLAMRPPESRDAGGTSLDLVGLREVIHKILEDLKAISVERSRSLLLVHLPTPWELGDGTVREWRDFLAGESVALDIPLLDTFETFETLAPELRARAFIPEGRIGYEGAEGHLSVEGNARIAQLVYARLRALMH
jgi:hypothetical protein